MKNADIDDNNKLEEEDEEEKDVVRIEFTEQQAYPENVKMLLTLDGWIKRRR